MRNRDLERAWIWAQKYYEIDPLATQLYNCRVALGIMYYEVLPPSCSSTYLDSLFALIDYRDDISKLVLQKIKGQKL